MSTQGTSHSGGTCAQNSASTDGYADIACVGSAVLQVSTLRRAQLSFFDGARSETEREEESTTEQMEQQRQRVVRGHLQVSYSHTLSYP